MLHHNLILLNAINDNLQDQFLNKVLSDKKGRWKNCESYVVKKWIRRKK